VSDKDLLEDFSPTLEEIEKIQLNKNIEKFRYVLTYYCKIKP
jgi:hypothetical protein